MDDNQFLNELRQSVVRRASTLHLVDTMAFVSEVAERLEEDPVFGEFVQLEYLGQGRSKRQLKLHGFTNLDEADGTLGLAIGSWNDGEEAETLLSSDVDQLTSLLENFIKESIEGDLNTRIAEVNPAYEVASLLANYQSKISRIRLHIFSNSKLSSRFREDRLNDIIGIPIERHIWDLQRLKAIYASSREREALEISLDEFGSQGIPCLEAARGDELRSFLCVIDGELLANLFDRYGSRLLEGNVRSFLGLKGGVNKGIRRTIQDEPALFFAYNNGIAATAANVETKLINGIPTITSISDLQIVNGGQTTASILSARKRDGLSLSGVTIQMKLTEVTDTLAHDLIPRIAEYANTQNKVAIADFFANHPFHRKMEEISRRLLVPSRPNLRVQSKWFYERSRGQYQNAKLYLTESKKKEYELEYPPEQLINKTDFAKYHNTFEAKPHWVSLGAQKSFLKFAGVFSPKSAEKSESEYWQEIGSNYGDEYFRRMVSVGILWKKTESIVSAGKGSWYMGDYRPQIVAYTLSLLFYSLRDIGRQLDLDHIWLKQQIELEIIDCINHIAFMVQKVILAPPLGSSHVGEWTKKETCWEQIKLIQLPTSLLNVKGTTGTDEHRRLQLEAQQNGALDDEIVMQTQVIGKATQGYWCQLLAWPRMSANLSLKEQSLVKRAETVSKALKIQKRQELRLLLDISKRCEDEGFRIAVSSRVY